jgi:hypothetical protein
MLEGYSIYTEEGTDPEAWANAIDPEILDWVICDGTPSTMPEKERSILLIYTRNDGSEVKFAAEKTDAVFPVLMFKGDKWAYVK